MGDDPMIGNQPQLLSNLANLRRTVSESVVSHYNVQPVFEIYANVQGRDLGSVSAEVNRVVDAIRPELPRGSTIAIRGQVESMNSSFAGLAFGLVFAVLLVYFLIVVNFQSWLDPFIILTALPGALAGILWMLFLTQTTLSVPALMGAIMCIGVATANSILMITFANDQRREGFDARAAALAAGSTRLRPVLMTALAMVVGMLPMSLGLGEGGEQNAPLGRAVIGGLLVATFFTLVFVPVLYTVLRKKPPAFGAPDDEDDAGASTDASFSPIHEGSHAESEAASPDDSMLVAAGGPPDFPGGDMMSDLVTSERVASERSHQPAVVTAVPRDHAGGPPGRIVATLARLPAGDGRDRGRLGRRRPAPAEARARAGRGCGTRWPCRSRGSPRWRPARRLPPPSASCRAARCRCWRRPSTRGPPDTSRAVASTSATTSRRATCSPRSTPRRSTPSSSRPARPCCSPAPTSAATRPARCWPAPS